MHRTCWCLCCSSSPCWCPRHTTPPLSLGTCQPRPRRRTEVPQDNIISFTVILRDLFLHLWMYEHVCASLCESHRLSRSNCRREPSETVTFNVDLLIKSILLWFLFWCFSLGLDIPLSKWSSFSVSGGLSPSFVVYLCLLQEHKPFWGFLFGFFGGGVGWAGGAY